MQTINLQYKSMLNTKTIVKEFGSVAFSIPDSLVRKLD